MNCVRVRVSAVLCLLSAGTLTVARAQDEANPAPEAPATESAPEPATTPPTVPTIPVQGAPEPQPQPVEATQLEDVVVTATKQMKSVRDIPASIDAFTGEDLEKLGASGMEDYLRYSPGVSVNKGLDQDSLYLSIRGVAANSIAGFFNRTYGLFYDDVTLVNPTIRGTEPNLDPWDMDTVEVLKGPQGTLFGGSALSGALRFVPVRPQVGGIFEGRAMAGYGTKAESGEPVKEYAAAANVPIGERFAMRLAGSQRAFPGTVEDLHSDRVDIDSGGNWQGRAIAAWQPLDALEMELTFLHRDAHQDDGSRVDNPRGRTIGIRRVPDRSHSKVDVSRLSAKWAFDEFSVVGVGSYLKKAGLLDFDQTQGLHLENGPGYAHQLVTPHVTQPSFEARVQSNQTTVADGSWSWLLGGWDYLLGAFYQKSDQLLLLPIYQAASPGAPEQKVLGIDLDAVATEKALYFDTTRHLGDKFELGLGGRVFRQVTEGGSVTYSEDPVLHTPIETNTGRARLPEKGFSPKLSLTWHFNRDLSVYTAAAKGFRYGGINAVIDPRDNLTFKSDHLWSYELGVRTQWFERRLRVDLAAFYIDWTNVQIEEVKTGLLSTEDNIGGARSQGVELGTQALLPFGFHFTGNVTYVDSRTTQAFQSVDGPVKEGARMPATPSITSSTILAYPVWLGAFELDSALTWTHQSTANNSLVPSYRLPAYSLLNASLSIARKDLRFQPSLSVNVNNLRDQDIIVTQQSNIGAGVPNPRYWWNQPRTITANLGFRF